ncbi:unnamed protein product [Zymoseptoria tritici ST99CH_3D1]|nr:unnamed protein product [Zymoseptoria tritici ST99CH_3D1]
MASIAQPIIRGDFHHDGYQLLVNVAGKLYSRACESDIRACLYGWQQDRAASWWEAQVVHYNLLRTNLKDMCKSRLWEAIEQGGLKAQPANVAAMAEEMRREFESAVREAGRLGFPGAGMSVRPAKRGRCDEGAEDCAKKTRVLI